MPDSPLTDDALRKQVIGLAVLDAFSTQVARASGPDELVTVAVETLARLFGYSHSMLLLANETGDCLYAVASHGYEASGAGAEVSLGEGVIGVAAERQQTVRVTNLAHDFAYSQAVRSGVERQSDAGVLEREIALPGLAIAYSQIAVPMVDGDSLLGVLCLESEISGRFSESDEAALNVAARQVSLALALLRSRAPATPPITAEVNTQVFSDRTMVIKHYAADDSVFIANDYVIKGVAGAILWRLLSAFVNERRTDLSNREIRLDTSLDLPDLGDNIESRLVLLRRRLADRCDFLRLQSAGRGRFRLVVDREITLLEVPK